MKLEYKDRKAIIDHLENGVPVSELSQRFGVTKTRIYALRKQYREDGLEALKPKSQRPHHCPTELRRDQREAIWAAGLNYAHLGLHGIHRKLLGAGVIVSRNSVHRYLAQAGLGTRPERGGKLKNIVQGSGMEALTTQQLTALEYFFPECSARHLLAKRTGDRFLLSKLCVRVHSRSQKALKLTFIQDLNSFYCTCVINNTV